MSSSDEIARLLNLGAADRHALMEVITKYFAESNVDPETDEEDISVEDAERDTSLEEPMADNDIESLVQEATDAICSGVEYDLGHITVDGNNSLDLEESRIAQFVAEGCKCKLADGNPCCQLFSASMYKSLRDECHALTRDELDLVVMGQLRALVHNDRMTQKTKARNTERVRTSTQFLFGGHRVCTNTFCFLHTMSRKRLRCIKARWMENGLGPRNRVQHLPHNTTPLSEIQRFVQFVLRYAEEKAILLPGRIPGYKRDDLQLLPSSSTKRDVWDLYHRTALESEGARAVCYSFFCRLWRQLTPQVVVTKPMSDLCWTCQQNSTLIMRAHNRPVEEKSEALRRAEEHLTLVTQERSVYKNEVERSRKNVHAHFGQDGVFVPPTPNGVIAPATNHITVHYSFDFAQQVHYPSNPLQPGPIYFLTPRKAAIFGICCEAIPRQVNFIIDEASDTGKGANTVVSLLDYFFEHHGLGETTVSLHADNCSGQNKNNTMVQYLMWRVLTGLHNTVNLHFMITGHTKFSPDACFGLVKRKFRKTPVSSLDDLARVVDDSAACNVCQLVGAQDGRVIIPTRDWAGFLSSYFRRLDGIKQYHHFHFERDHPGAVFLRKTAVAEEEERKLLRVAWRPSVVDKPPSITPQGLSYERRKYLHKKIREYCRDDVRDIVCPDPDSPVPVIRLQDTSSADECPAKRMCL